MGTVSSSTSHTTCVGVSDQNSEEIKLDPIEYLVVDLVKHIFTFLDMASLVSCCLVSKSWYAIASEDDVWRGVVQREFALGKEDLETLFENADVGEEPLLPNNIVEILKGPCPFSEEGESVFQTHVLKLFPGKINGIKLDHATFGNLHYPSTQIQCQWSPCLGQFIPPPIERSRWGLITEPVLVGDGRKSGDELSNDVRKIVGYEPLKSFEAEIHMITHYMRTKERLFALTDSLGMTATVCQESVRNICQDSVGNNRIMVGLFGEKAYMITTEAMGNIKRCIVAVREL